jgi:hypothetical protein
MAEAIPVLLHISVFLFFFAFSEFLRNAHNTVGLVARYCTIVLLSAYLILSIHPLIFSNSPYQTALTTPLRPCAILILVAFRLFMCAISTISAGHSTFPLLPKFPAIVTYKRPQHLLRETEGRAAQLDHLSLHWLLEDADGDSMNNFVTELPELVDSPFIKDPMKTMKDLVTDGMLDQVHKHFTSSMSSRELSQAAGITRAFACLEALDSIFSVLDECSDGTRYENVTKKLIESCDDLCTRQDSAVALHAACVRALTFRKLIIRLSTPTRACPSYLSLPPHLSPFALRLQTWASVNSRLWRSRDALKGAGGDVIPYGYNARRTIVSDGHLINFLVLILDVLPHAEQSTLNFTAVWEALELLLGAFSITKFTASPSAVSRFEEVHADIRAYFPVSVKRGTPEGPIQASLTPVSTGAGNPDISRTGDPTSEPLVMEATNTSSNVGNTVQSFPVYGVERYGPLLGFMDKADKGLRLMGVLSGNLPQPGGEVRLRHDQIFSKDPFGSLDVLNAFSSALPTFVVESTDLERARATVKKMITVDDLFLAIGGHLGISLSPGVPKTTRERMSITCLQVLESVFRLFEGLTVDWYELGVDAVLKSTDNVASSSEIVGDPSTIYAYCALGITNCVVIGQLRSRIVRDSLPTRLNSTEFDAEEQPLIRKVYDRLFPGREQIRDLRPAYLIANQELSLPQYLRNLLINGPLQNFSTIASCMMPHLKRKGGIPDIVWRTLHTLSEVPGLPDADDGVTLNYFCEVRDSMYNMTIEEEHRSKDQLEVLRLLNTVAARLRFPELPILNLQ